MMEQLEKSDVTEEEMSDVDREMFNRMNATENGQLIGRVKNVSLESSDIRGEYVMVETKTPVGEKADSFPLPETPTDNDEIVRLCKANGVDPKYPSMLEGCEVKWDGDDMVIPKTRKQKFTEPIEGVLDGMDTYSHLKEAFFFTFLPITLTTYYLMLDRRDRHHMRQSLEDFGFHIMVWGIVTFAFFGLTSMTLSVLL